MTVDRLLVTLRVVEKNNVRRREKGATNEQRTATRNTLQNNLSFGLPSLPKDQKIQHNNTVES